MSRKYQDTLFFLLGFFLVQGGVLLAAEPLTREVVLCQGMKISVHDPASENELVIECKKASERELTINGSKRTVNVLNRFSRWYGSYGVYTKSRWHLFDSIRWRSHITYQEGIQHFCSLEEAMMWIKQIKSYATVYNNSEGILVSIRFVKEKNLWDIELWRICVGGSIPNLIADVKECIQFVGDSRLPKCYALDGFKFSEPKIVEGVYFTGRVLDLMNEHGIGCDDVIEAIQNGSIKTYSKGRKMYEYGPRNEHDFIDPFRSIQVFTDSDGHVELIKVSPMWNKGVK